MAASVVVPPRARDAVFAAATPPGTAAIAVFLLDGEAALARFSTVFRSREPLRFDPPGQLVLGHIRDADGGLVDEAIAAPVRARDAETGCEQIELSCHGGRGTAAAVREALAAAGFREAAPWELAARAHRAARLALPDLEIRLRLARAETARQTEFLLASGRMRERWERLGMVAALAMRRRETGWRAPLADATEAALRQAVPALQLLTRHRLAIAGPVNAGKSALANALLRAEKSLVSSVPGATRDLLARPAAIRGLAAVVCDSAGLTESEAPDEIESEGQRRAREAARAADLTVIVLDGSRAPSEAECDLAGRLARPDGEPARAAAARPRALLVLNKSDLRVHPEAEGLAFALETPCVAVSALTGRGVVELETAIERACLGDGPVEPGAPFTRRQVRALEGLRAALREALDGEQLIGHIRDLAGTRPNERELAAVLGELAAE